MTDFKHKFKPGDEVYYIYPSKQQNHKRRARVEIKRLTEFMYEIETPIGRKLVSENQIEPIPTLSNL